MTWKNSAVKRAQIAAIAAVGVPAIAALGSGIDISNLYSDKSGDNNGKFFRDITTGSNGDCAYYCSARKHYDYITGLGSPLTSSF